jgi:putative CocE/NonD family hydrolase
MRRTAPLLAAAALIATGAPVLAAARTPAATQAWRPRPATYGVAKQTNVPIRMDDGVVLEADVLRPAAPNGQPAKGRFPVILTQTPYNKNVPSLNFENDYLIQRGYIQVIVDVRGTGSSGGEWTSFGPREQKDYYETAEWARHVPGSDGRLALYGISYGAIDALLTAAEDPPGLKAVFPIVPMADAYRDVTVQGGETDDSFIPLWLGLVTAGGLLPGTETPTDPQQSATALLSHALGVSQFQAVAIASSVSGQQVQGIDAEYDGSFYNVRSPINVIDRVHVPTFIVGGEYDLFQRGEPMLYNALRADHVPTRLLIGPWTHLAASSGTGLPADGVPSLSELELRWFDHYVRGVPDPTLNTDIPPVTVYRLGAGRYQRFSSYPPADTRYRTLALGGSSTPGQAGTLGSAHPAAGTGTVPPVPIAGLCSQSVAQWTAGAVPEGEPCTGNEAPNDLFGATYDLPIGRHGFRFAGTSMARLYVSTTASDAFVTVRLEDVSPSGSVASLSAGWQLLSLRAVDPARSAYANGLMIQPWHPDTRASVLPVAAGKVYQLDVEIFPTLAYLAPGHILRLAVQTADFPHSAASLPETAMTTGGVLTIYENAKYRSELVLGVE